MNWNSRFTNNQLETVATMLANNKEMIAIAHETGIHLHDIQRIAKAISNQKLSVLTGQRRKLTQDDRQWLLGRYKRSGKTQSRFARDNDICVSTMNTIIRTADGTLKTVMSDFITLEQMICNIKQSKPMLTQAWV